VPLFLEELTKVILEEAVTATGEPVSVPPTLHASLLARLDRLGPDAKEVAQIGSAIGRQFSFEMLAAAAGQNVTRLRAGIGGLVEAGLVFQRGIPPQAMFLFKHALVQEAAYSSLLRTVRQGLHARIADVLLSTGGEQAAVAPEVIAHHFGERRPLCRGHCVLARGRRAGSPPGRQPRSNRTFPPRLGLLETQPETAKRLRIELAVLSQLGPVLMSVYGWSAPQAGEAVERAAKIGRGLESSADLAPSIANLAVFHIYRCQLDQAEHASADLFRIATELHDPEITLQAHHCTWPVQWHRGRPAQALEHCDAGLALYEEQRDVHRRHVYFGHDPAVCALALGAAAKWALGYPVRAMHRHGEAITLARRLRDPPSLAHSIFCCATSQIAAGDAKAVFATATELRELSEWHGFSQFQAYAVIFLGWALACSGEAESGITEIREGFGMFAATGSPIPNNLLHYLKAEAHLMARQYREGLESVAQGLGFAETGDQHGLARLHRLRAELLLHLDGSNDEAVEASLRRAISVARRQGAKGWELPAATGLARLWADRGRRKKAHDLLAPVYGWFTEGYDTPDLRAAKELLDALS